jgi:hypothetical protein
VTAPTADALREAILPLLTAAGWTITDPAHTLSEATRGDLGVALLDSRVIVQELQHVEGAYWFGERELLNAEVTTVAQAIGYLRVAGALRAEPEMPPVLVDALDWRWYHVGDGRYIERLTSEVWSRQQIESRRGPVAEAPADPMWSRRADGPAVQR